MSGFGTTAGRAMRVFTLLCFGCICLLMIASVVNRFVTLGSMGWSDEIIELLLVWTLFIGIAEVWRQGQHFRVGVVPDLLRGTVAGAVVAAFTQLGCLIFFAFLVWQSTDLMLQANDVSPIFSWSRRWWYLPMPIAGTIMALVTIGSLASQLRGPHRRTSASRNRHRETSHPESPAHE